MELTPGTQTFSLLAFAPAGLTVDYFGLSIRSELNFQSEALGPTSTVRTVLASTPLPALAVPEPSTYLLLFAGLLMIAVYVRRNNKR